MEYIFWVLKMRNFILFYNEDYILKLQYPFI